MEKKKRKNEPNPERAPHKVRLPGFLIEEEIGLGDVIKKTTYAMGIQPCGGCEKRAAALNRWISFTRRPRAQISVLKERQDGTNPE